MRKQHRRFVLKVRCCVHVSSWVVVLVEGRLERCGSDITASLVVRARRLGEGTSRHDVVIVLDMLLLASPDPPGYDGETSEKDGSTNTTDDTSNDILRALGETGTTGATTRC